LAYVGKKIAQIAQIGKTPKTKAWMPIFWAKPVFKIAQELPKLPKKLPKNCPNPPK